WRSFDCDNYLLAYFLHPGYRGIGLREQQFQTIAKAAIKIWQEKGHDQYECADLVALMRQFREKEDGFDLPYSFEKDTPLLWWMTNHIGSNSIVQLAIKIFSITPHSADCERTFSSLGWLYGKRRQRLSLSRIQAMAQIRTFCISNVKKELAFFDNESDSNSESSDDAENVDEIEHDESMTSDTIGRGVFDFDPTKLATDLVKEWNYESSKDINDSINSIDKMNEEISESLNNTGSESSVLENLPIALRKTCRQNP
ncbi:9265_t:CDS:2, partial [Racocetra persica]